MVASTGPKISSLDSHIIVHVVEYGRLNEAALPIADGCASASRDEFGALGFPLFDIAQNGLHLLLADEGAEARYGVHGIDRLHFLDPIDEFFHEGIFDFALDKKAGASRADFSFAVKNADGRTSHGSFQIGIRKNNIWRFAAEFERYMLECVHGTAANF